MAAKTALQDKILSLITEKGNEGATQNVLVESFSSVPADQIVAAVNVLSRKAKIQIVSHPTTGEPLYKAAADETQERLRGLTRDHIIIYRLVEAAGRDGISKKELKAKSGIPRNFPKVVKALEVKKLIKFFKSVTSKINVFYILFELEPADTHKGGIWYDSNREFDRQFVNVLTQQCHAYIKQKGYATIDNIRIYIQQSNISKVEVQNDDVQKLVNALVYDGLVESFKNPHVKGELCYKSTRLAMPTSGLTYTPCGICPVRYFVSSSRHCFLFT